MISARLPEDPFARPSPTVSVTVAAAGAATTNATEPLATPEPTVAPAVSETAMPTALPAVETPPVIPTAAGGRAPWILLPRPAPGARVPRGVIVVAARGRGDAAIADIRLELDGAALHAQIEQRTDSIWLAQASTTVETGPHAARAVVTDAGGRVGAYRWSFSVV
jgi:hypothetical protein